MTTLTPLPDPDGAQGHFVHRRLLDEIRSGALKPGARLRETELAVRLGLSRTPVREAIRMLEADGLVAHVPRQGASIRRLDHAEVMELYEMRIVLEGTAARLAARAASELELSELAQINAEIADAATPAQAAQLNHRFHLVLVDTARNRFLARAMAGLRRTYLILGPSTLADPGRAARALEEHDEILDALRARDGATAEALMRHHIEGAHRQRLRQLRETGDDGTDTPA